MPPLNGNCSGLPSRMTRARGACVAAASRHALAGIGETEPTAMVSPSRSRRAIATAISSAAVYSSTSSGLGDGLAGRRALEVLAVVTRPEDVVIEIPPDPRVGCGGAHVRADVIAVVAVVAGAGGGMSAARRVHDGREVDAGHERAGVRRRGHIGVDDLLHRGDRA